MNQKLQKRMLSELRCAVYLPREAEVTEDALTKAITVNENLMTLGYTLNPADVARLAVSPSLNGFYENIKGLMGDVTAEPMYPDFPQQVMEMDEAKFRFHQILHYLSTYGIEELFGERMRKGWLPYENQGTTKTKKDDVLLAAKVLELLPEKDAAFTAASRILQRRERMTLPEKELAVLAMGEIAPEKLAELTVPFKENLIGIFAEIVTQWEKKNCEREQALAFLRAICKHTGDVLRCVDYVLTRNKFHFRTSQKRFLVNLIERYPAEDLKANVILSRKKSERAMLMLQYLDYNLYSKSEAHREAVRALRDGELSSWEGQARYLLSVKADGALEFVSKRPGMMLRMVAWMIKLGYPASDIKDALLPHAGELSTQTMVRCLDVVSEDLLVAKQQLDFASEPDSETDAKWWERELDRCREVFAIFETLLKENLRKKETVLRGKKVYVDMEDYDLELSAIRTNDKSEEGGYVRSGIAYRIPEDVRALRAFVYWNDPKDVDIDLHASGIKKTGDGRGYEAVSIGWNSDFKNSGIVYSGDITHSDAAEYIDVDMSVSSDIRMAGININIFYGKRCFRDIETCYVGMMAVKNAGQEVKLYDPANCFFTHELRGTTRTIQYGYIDVPRRVLVLDGKQKKGDCYALRPHPIKRFNLQKYLDTVFKQQDVTVVKEKEQADLVLKMGKAEDEKDVSLIDQNFFLD